MGVEELTEDELTSLRTGEKLAVEDERFAKAFSAAENAEDAANLRALEAARAAKPRFS